ncbi:hypothetical protein CDAR_464301 [Caerostris darwini]|uniref:Uncharacterized protein n=1 Tax=Caerostris darwini TaxID=1538125 RepID=A0AAV4VTF1_9ARAC|nr:hypothetical protein CDAR_464301 [Caerostris darwini]
MQLCFCSILSSGEQKAARCLLTEREVFLDEWPTFPMAVTTFPSLIDSWRETQATYLAVLSELAFIHSFIHVLEHCITLGRYGLPSHTPQSIHGLAFYFCSTHQP